MRNLTQINLCVMNQTVPQRKGNPLVTSTQSPLLQTCVTGKGTGWSPYSSGLQAAPSGLSTQHMEVGSPVALLHLQR
jgi:hypothetical protein